MTWVVWRQHRGEGMIALGVLATLAVFLLITRLAIGPGIFLEQYSWLPVFAGFLPLLPVLLGALVGAPLVARELEQRTYVLAWTQSISRSHWLGMKLTLVLGTGVLLCSILMAEVIWWWNPFAQERGSFVGTVFDFTGPVFPAAALLALALGVFAGALTRRTVLAIFLTIMLFLAIRLPVEVVFRPHFMSPITVTWPIEQATPPVTLSAQDWIIAEGLIDNQGNKFNTTISTYCSDPENTSQCLQSQGFRANYLTYQPADRFWTFQWIETSIYVTFSALALVATVWLVRRLA